MGYWLVECSPTCNALAHFQGLLLVLRDLSLLMCLILSHLSYLSEVAKTNLDLVQLPELDPYLWFADYVDLILLLVIVPSGSSVLLHGR